MGLKFTFYSIIIAGLCITSANAQETVQEGNGISKFINKYRLSLFGGLGSSNLNPTSSQSGGNYNFSVSKVKGRTSYAFGLNAEKRIDRRYSLYSGLSMEWLGGTILANAPVFLAADSNEYARSASMSYRLQYLHVPLGLKLKASSIKKFTIYGLVGADLGVPIGRKANYTIATTDAVTPTVSNIGEKLKFNTIVPVSVAYQLGAGTEFKITEDNSAYLTLLYRNGFIDHTQPDNLNKPKALFKDGVVRSNNLSLRLGFFF
jgi:Outer membrane protein beta-barrel domain